MYKILFALFLTVVCILLQAQQLDEELAVKTLFQTKQAVNRAAHAAAQQVDKERLSVGFRTIDERRAEQTMLAYLQHNLQLDAENQPLSGSLLKEPLRVLVFEVINDEEHFPFEYRNEAYNFTVTLHRPGVIIVVGIYYPRISLMVDPIYWEVKGAAELHLF